MRALGFDPLVWATAAMHSIINPSRKVPDAAIRYAAYGIAVGFCSVSMLANVCFSVSVATTPAEQMLLISISVLLDLFKGLALILAFRLWQRRYRTLAVAALVMGVGSLAWSTIGAVGFVATIRTNTDTVRTSVMEQQSAWATTVRRADERLEAIGLARPVAVIEADISALVVPPHVWTQTRECTEPTSSSRLQRACAPVLKLRRELSAARAAEQLETQITGTRTQLATLPTIGSTDPQLAALARIFQATEPAMRDTLAIMLAALVELGSTLGLAIARGATQPNTPAIRVTAPKSGHRTSRTKLRVIQRTSSFVRTHVAEEQPHHRTIERWVAVSLAVDPSGEVPARAAYASYCDWATRNGVEPCTETRFGTALTQLVMRRRGRKDIRRSGRYYAGVRFIEPPNAVIALRTAA